MIHDTDTLAREILDRLAVIDRLRAADAEFRALDCCFLFPALALAIRHEHYRIHLLADLLGLPLLPMRDVAACARAQLGLPLDAPLPAPKLRKPRPAAWQRDLAAASALVSHPAP